MPNIWPFPVSSISEVLSFETDVRRTTTREFRDGIRDATQRLTLMHALKDLDAGHAEAWFRSGAADEWYVPLWQGATFGSSALAGAGTLTVDPNADYRAGGKALIVESGSLTSYELVDVLSLVGTTLTLDGMTVSQNYTRPVIMPVLTALAPQGLGRAARVGMSFLTAEFVVTEPLDLSADNLSDYDGFDLFSEEQAIFSALEGSTQRRQDFYETGFGSFSLDDIETYTRFRGALNLARRTNAERWALTQFLHRARGRERPFYVPTWKRDLEVLSAVGSQIEVPIVTFAATDLEGRHIQIDTGSAVIQREITGTAVGASSITLTLNSALGVSVPTSSRVSWLHLCRFDADSFNLEHRRTSDGYLTTFAAPLVEVTG